MNFDGIAKGNLGPCSVFVLSEVGNVTVFGVPLWDYERLQKIKQNLKLWFLG